MKLNALRTVRSILATFQIVKLNPRFSYHTWGSTGGYCDSGGRNFTSGNEVALYTADSLPS